MKIAPNLRAELDHMYSTLKDIDGIVDRKSRQNFRQLQKKLDNWAARIAVIGQVKAGKSTFLNAFLHQEDFLPSDVNPWTSVVTNIRINIPKDPASGASFTFFDESDWQEIIDGGSRIRKLTEQLLPGFDTELLRQQSEEMKQRAQRRLGKHYRALLGTVHDYDFLTPDLLKRYVCAGPGSDDRLAGQSLGRYAALTKVANAYMRMPEFQVPTIVTDTPGVNDPFLVRDEFTCRSLDKSDVFVVALSAHQPLTDVDIALIRILAKQDSKDVLIFVNRIDELDDYNIEVPRVLKDVERRLRLAIPDIEFKIVAGSAFMASVAMRNDREAAAARHSLDNAELSEYLAKTYGHVPEDQIDRLLLASGIDNVKRTLSDLIDNGVGRGQLAQIFGDIRAELSATQFLTKQERASIHAQVETVRSDLAGIASEEVTQDIERITAVHSELESLSEAADNSIEKVITTAWSRLEMKLISRVESFIDGQQKVLQDHISRVGSEGAKGRPLEVDLAPLQALVEVDVFEGFCQSRAGTDLALNRCMDSCRTLIKERFGDPTENIDLEDLPYEEFVSTFLLAKKTLRVDLVSDRGWKFWTKTKVNADKTLAALRSIAAEELRPPIEKILAIFNEAQVERASAGMSRVHVMLRMIEATLNDQIHRLKRDKATMDRLATDEDARNALAHNLQSKIEVLERRLINLAALDSALQRPKLSNAA